LNEVTITVDDTPHTVPEGLTVVQAMWHMGREIVHDVGCLGGACGACTISIRFPGRFDNQCKLACQTLVSEGMTISFLPPDTSRKVLTPLPDTEATGQELFKYYPETRRCVACRACSMVCPIGIDAMGGVRAAIMGQHKDVAEKFEACVMCGLCAAVCGSGIQPHRVGAFTRRFTGAFFEKEATYLLDRIKEIASGQYQDEWNTLLSSDENESREEILNECS
jgi:succinate dehydrogenase/fumarate reductase-like Fe-S protein